MELFHDGKRISWTPGMTALRPANTLPVVFKNSFPNFPRKFAWLLRSDLEAPKHSWFGVPLTLDL